VSSFLNIYKEKITKLKNAFAGRLGLNSPDRKISPIRFTVQLQMTITIQNALGTPHTESFATIPATLRVVTAGNNH